MRKKELFKRYIIFLCGLVVTSFGVSFVTKATLGTSPIAAVPYSLSLVFTRLSVGNWMILFNLLLVLIQLLILRKNAKKTELVLQSITAFLFGYLIDGSMSCLQALHPSFYAVKLICLVLGCGILAFGVYLELTADVTMLPGDALPRVAAKVLHKEYGIVRVVSDISMSVIGGVICLIFLHQLSGVREGTILSALLVGNLIQLFSKVFASLTKLLVQ